TDHFTANDFTAVTDSSHPDFSATGGPIHFGFSRGSSFPSTNTFADNFIVNVNSTTWVVNSANDADDGVCDATHCSLREAINAANANDGADTITFNIPGSGVHTITPSTALPFITGQVTIDGYTQSGASA